MFTTYVCCRNGLRLGYPDRTDLISQPSTWQSVFRVPLTYLEAVAFPTLSTTPRKVSMVDGPSSFCHLNRIPSCPHSCINRSRLCEHLASIPTHHHEIIKMMDKYWNYCAQSDPLNDICYVRKKLAQALNQMARYCTSHPIVYDCWDVSEQLAP